MQFNVWDVLLIIFVLILCALGSFFYKKFRGYMGEFWVKLELKKLPKSEYIILNNIVIKTKENTHQIDHIVLSKFGIFVIEMKNYYGLITGSEYSNKWIQYLGKNKYYFYNPIRQNYGHIKALEEVLGLDANIFISIICISNQARLSVQARNVVNIDYLNDLIKEYKKVVVKEDLMRIKERLEKSNIRNIKIRRHHTKEIKKYISNEQKKINNMICPKCNGKLVERSGKYGRFIGCSNYPKCKYTTQINWR